jgi:hypothetical protein
LRIILFQSLVQGICVAAEKERKKNKKTKEVPTVEKNLAAEKESSCCWNERNNKRQKKSEKVSISAVVLSLFCVTIFVCRFASLSKV